jgi:hypothetical protein
MPPDWETPPHSPRHSQGGSRSCFVKRPSHVNPRARADRRRRAAASSNLRGVSIDAIVLRLPDGAQAVVTARQARAIADRLWDLGLTPGAAVSATKILDAIQSMPAVRQPIEFDERETHALVKQRQA